MSEVFTYGPFTDEATAADMAFKLGELEDCANIIIEGDALNVIRSISQGSLVAD